MKENDINESENDQSDTVALTISCQSHVVRVHVHEVQKQDIQHIAVRGFLLQSTESAFPPQISYNFW